MPVQPDGHDELVVDEPRGQLGDVLSATGLRSRGLPGAARKEQRDRHGEEKLSHDAGQRARHERDLACLIGRRQG